MYSVKTQVKENIDQFGGDPRRITLGGQEVVQSCIHVDIALAVSNFLVWLSGWSKLSWAPSNQQPDWHQPARSYSPVWWTRVAPFDTYNGGGRVSHRSLDRNLHLLMKHWWFGWTGKSSLWWWCSSPSSSLTSSQPLLRLLLAAVERSWLLVWGNEVIRRSSTSKTR